MFACLLIIYSCKHISRTFHALGSVPSRVAQFSDGGSHTNKQLQCSVKNAAVKACPKDRLRLAQDVGNYKGKCTAGGVPVEE